VITAARTAAGDALRTVLAPSLLRVASTVAAMASAVAVAGRRVRGRDGGIERVGFGPVEPVRRATGSSVLHPFRLPLEAARDVQGDESRRPSLVGADTSPVGIAQRSNDTLQLGSLGAQ